MPYGDGRGPRWLYSNVRRFADIIARRKGLEKDVENQPSTSEAPRGVGPCGNGIPYGGGRGYRGGRR